MPRYKEDLLIKPSSTLNSSGETLVVTPDSTGFDYLTVRINKVSRGEKLASKTSDRELGMVVLGGRCSVESTAGSWLDFGGRAHVFDGLPHALYLPIETEFTVSAVTDCEVALCFSRAEEKYPARLIRPHETMKRARC